MKKKITRKKPTRGGARPGAGRKPLGRIKRLISLTPSALEELQRRAAQKSVPMGYVLDALLTTEGRTK